jgi:hypothetical protein
MFPALDDPRVVDVVDVEGVDRAAESLGLRSPTISSATPRARCGEHAIGDEHLPRAASAHSRAARLVTLPIAA